MEQFVYAGKRGGCGLASLKMLLIHYQKQRGYAFLESDDNGSLESLRQIAEKEGVGILWKKADDKNALSNNQHFPLLLLLKEGEDGHLVYLRSKRKDSYRIYDPDIGEKKFKESELLEKWTGIYGEGCLLHKKECRHRKPKLFTSAGIISISLAFLASIASLLAAFFFLKENYSPLLTIGMLSSFAIGFVLERFFFMSEMKRFDKRHACAIATIRSEKETVKDNYLHYNAFKRLAFSRLKWWLEGPLSLMAILLLFGFDSPSFLLSGAFLIGISLISSIILGPKFQRKGGELAKMEESLLNGNPNESDKMMASLFSKTYLFAKAVEYRKIISLASTLLLALIPVFMEKRIELNYFLLEFFALLGIHEAISPVCAMLEESDGYKKELSYFSCHFAKKQADGITKNY